MLKGSKHKSVLRRQFEALAALNSFQGLWLMTKYPLVFMHMKKVSETYRQCIEED